MAPETPAPRAATIAFEGATPILRVRDLAASLDFYMKVLGFALDFQDPGIFASVSRGRCRIFLCEGDQGNPGTWVWIGVGDVDPLFEDYSAKGAAIRHPPTNYPWAYEMQVEDPDSHVLRFGAEPRKDQPFGEWLDMRGVRWTKSASGQTMRVDAD
jgi:catechol 2,3-dioxygenase-like lactoylglutathione lyase family enzyme